jgi:hypothetical protein
MVARDPMSAYDQLVKDWQNAAGNKIKQEYDDAIATARRPHRSRIVSRGRCSRSNGSRTTPTAILNQTDKSCLEPRSDAG